MFHAHLPPTLHLSRDIAHPQVSESSWSMNPSKPTRCNAARPPGGMIFKRFTDGHWKEDTDTCIYNVTMHCYIVCMYIYNIHIYIIYRVYVYITYTVYKQVGIIQQQV